MRTKFPRKVRRSHYRAILPLYTISLGPLYHKILRPPLVWPHYYSSQVLKPTFARQPTILLNENVEL